MISTKDIAQLIALLEKAGQVIMSFYLAQNFEVNVKTDDSPVTSADHASNEIILSGLKELYPNIPIISEETVKIPYETRKNWDYCWMVDPLDGTKEFLKHNGEFSINLALIKNQIPIAGFIHFPVQQWTYYALNGRGAYKKASEEHIACSNKSRIKSGMTKAQSRIKSGMTKAQSRIKSGMTKAQSRITSHQSPINLKIMISRSHASSREHAFIEKLQSAGYVVETHPHGSAMKHCLIAEGIGDIYPKFGVCSEWDTAPGQIILQEAGGEITSVDNGQALLYNKPNFENPEFIMWGPRISDDVRKLIMSKL